MPWTWLCCQAPFFPKPLPDTVPVQALPSSYSHQDCIHFQQPPSPVALSQVAWWVMATQRRSSCPLECCEWQKHLSPLSVSIWRYRLSRSQGAWGLVMGSLVYWGLCSSSIHAWATGCAHLDQRISRQYMQGWWAFAVHWPGGTCSSLGIWLQPSGQGGSLQVVLVEWVYINWAIRKKNWGAMNLGFRLLSLCVVISLVYKVAELWQNWNGDNKWNE